MTQYYAPDYELDVRPSNMDNANSREYLSKIRDQCLENLRRTQHAPSVQMTDVPRDSLGGMNDDDEAALDDQDEDEYPDRRNTQRRADKYIEKNGELSDSEDEEMNEQNGIRKQIAEKSRRARINYRGIQDVHNDSGMDSAIGTPAGGSSLPDIDNDVDMDEGAVSAAPSLEGAANDSALASGVASPQVAADADTMMEDAEVAPAAPRTATEESSTAQQEATPPDSPPHTSEPAPSSILDSAGPTTTADIKKEIEAEDTSIAAEAEGRKERDEADAEGQLQTEAAAVAQAKQETPL
jgi:histone deacetylase 1/2